MAQRPVTIEVAELVWGNDYEAVPNPYFPERASKMVCRKCGKEYSPGSTAYMVRHKTKHLVEEAASSR